MAMQKPPNKKSIVRMLAAVMFIDMEGYTAMMQQDENQAIRLRERQHRVLEELVGRYAGRIRQYYGDGALVTFPSAVEGVGCAVEIQQELQKPPRVPARIGFHLGDIACNEDGAYGDAVNIAARIEALAAPGGILISGKMLDEVKNHRRLGTRFFGKYSLKNVNDPVAVYKVVSPGLVDSMGDKTKPEYETSENDGRNKDHLIRINVQLITGSNLTVPVSGVLAYYSQEGTADRIALQITVSHSDSSSTNAGYHQNRVCMN